MFHLFLHFFVPLLVSVLLIKQLKINIPNLNYINLPHWVAAWIVMTATMIIDVDHFLATPIYQANRCSIGFHPLHTFLPISAYFLLCFPKNTRLVGLGLIIHMILDSIDCKINTGVWFV